MPRKPEEATVTPNVKEAKPPVSVGATHAGATHAGATQAGATHVGATQAGATQAGATVPAPTLPVTETPWSAEEEIRRRAYELYERDGRQDGRDREHWLLAETEILGRGNEARAHEARADQARVSQRAPRRSQKSA